MVLGVVMILIGLTLPGLAGARRAARGTLCTGQVRLHGVALAAYAIDQKDLWPYAPRPGFLDPFNANPLRLDSPYEPHAYTWVEDYWHAPLVRAYGLAPFDGTLDCPESTLLTDARDTMPMGNTRTWATSRNLSMAMFLHPDALVPERPSWLKKHFITQRVSDVAFPSTKASLYELYPWHDPRIRWDGRTLLLMPPYLRTVAGCDGAVSIRNTGDCTPSIVFATQLAPRFDGAVQAQSLLDTFRFTPHGQRGFDWR